MVPVAHCLSGRNCVFSHDLQQETERPPCKYFQKGNCRFGAKCALAHIMPDGRRVNHLPRGNAPAPVFGRIVPENRPFQTSGIHDQIVQSQHQQPMAQIKHVDEFPALSNQLAQLRVDEVSSKDQPLFIQNVTEWQDQQRQSPRQAIGNRGLMVNLCAALVLMDM